MQAINFLTCTLGQLRYWTTTWSDGVLLEALRKVRATWKVYANKMPEEEMHKLLRREAIVRTELRKRMRHAGVAKELTHKAEEKLIGHNPGESPFKIGKRG